MSGIVERGKKEWTEADLEALSADGSIHEVVDGELVMSPKNSFDHGDICSRLFLALGNYAQAHRLGFVLDSSTGFWMANRNCRASDISFISRTRLVAAGFRAGTRRFFPGGPDLAVEVLSPSNTRREIEARLRDYFSSGTQLAWVIDPVNRTAQVFRSPSEVQTLLPDGVLDGAQLLPGFKYRIVDLFKEWDWD